MGELIGRVTGSARGLRGGQDIQATVDLTVPGSYGQPIPDVTKEIRHSVIHRAERLTSLEMIEANITVADIYFFEHR